MRLSKRGWQVLWIATLVFCAIIMKWYSDAVAKEYAALNDSYMIEVSENNQLQTKVYELEAEIAELREQLPK